MQSKIWPPEQQIFGFKKNCIVLFGEVINKKIPQWAIIYFDNNVIRFKNAMKDVLVLRNDEIFMEFCEKRKKIWFTKQIELPPKLTTFDAVRLQSITK